MAAKTTKKSFWRI